MNREEFAKIIKAIDSVYCSADKPILKDSYAIEIWFSCLQDLDYATCGKAVKNLFLTAKFRPSIAEVREEYSKLTKKPSDDLTEQDAWALVRRALRNGTYGAEEEFRRLPGVVQMAVAHPTNIRVWSQLGSQEVETVIQSHFLRNYRNVNAIMEKDNVVGVIGTKRGECSGLIEQTSERIGIDG